MKNLLLISGFVLVSLVASAQEEPRKVQGFVGQSVQVFDEQLKPAGKLSPEQLRDVRFATRNGSTPFYKIEAGGRTLMVLGSKITFEDRPRTDMIPCNSRETDFAVSTFNSTMGSGEKKSCAEVAATNK